jgi:hypothetical protein
MPVPTFLVVTQCHTILNKLSPCSTGGEHQSRSLRVFGGCLFSRGVQGGIQAMAIFMLLERLRVSIHIIKREFRFYLAKGYTIIASKNEEGDLDGMNYLLTSLDSYNKYLLRKLKFGIKNINKIYSNIMISSGAKKRYEIIKVVCQCLGEEDRLKLATYLSTLYKLPETEQFLVKESLVQKLKAIGAFLIAAIPIVISIIQLVSRTG